MNTRPTYESLAPREEAPFTTRQRRRDMSWGREALPATFDVRTLVIPTAVATIRKAFTQAKTSRDSWKSAQRHGRVDIRQAPRTTMSGAQDVFRRKAGRSTTHVKVSVLIDASGSMGNRDAEIARPDQPGKTITVTRKMGAAVFGATIATALGAVPTVNLDVFQHSASGGQLYLKWRWHKGTPVAVFNEALQGIGGGANADGHALYAITEKMLREMRPTERGVIMVVSDGLPSVYARNATATGDTANAGGALVDAIAHARKRGITVIGVAIDGSDQKVYYGDGCIPFTGNWTTLGSQLARVIGKALSTR